jgi:hypothetical protein
MNSKQLFHNSNDERAYVIKIKTPPYIGKFKKVLEAKVDDDMKVGRLKELIYDEYGTPVYVDYAFLCNENMKLLDDERTFRQYNIKENDTIIYYNYMWNMN